MTGKRKAATSEEYRRFEDLTKRLVAVPKGETNGKPEKKPKPSRSARRK
jgi:hypothetical protein